MRVAVDATALIGTPTGVGAFCSGLLAGLGEREDVSVMAFAVSWRRRRAAESKMPEGVALARRAMPARPLQLAWRRVEAPAIEWFVGPVEVVHGTNYVVPPAKHAARVVTVHDLTTVRYPELCDDATLAFPKLVARAIARGAWVHTHSDAVAAEVVEVFGAEKARVRPVASGIPALPPPDPSAPARYLPPGASRYVLAVGTAEPRKDLPGLVEAFDAIAAARPELALVLAGPDGWGTAQLEEAVRTARHSGRVVRTGWVDGGTLSGLVHGAAVLAYPSRYEGFGYPPLQAMAAGIPVVSTTVGSLEEVLGEAAVLVAPGDPGALAGALEAVLDTAPWAAELRSRGLARAERYSWSRCAAGLVDLYRAAQRT